MNWTMNGSINTVENQMKTDLRRWSQVQHAQSCEVTSGLTHVACFTSVNLA